MEEFKLKGESLNIKLDQGLETPKANEADIQDSIKALGDEFDSMSKIPKIKTIGKSKK